MNDIGKYVTSELYDNYGKGQIIDVINKEEGKLYIVFFEKKDEKITLDKDDLTFFKTCREKFENNIFYDPDECKFFFLQNKIKNLISQEENLSPLNFKIFPLPHQLLALDFAFNQYNQRLLLADEVGLGKTIEAALIMEELIQRNLAEKILIVTPANLTRQWQDELRIKFNENFTLIDRQSFNHYEMKYGKDNNIWGNLDKVITSIDYLKPKNTKNTNSKKELNRRKNHNENVFNDCINTDWDLVIIDEAHKLSKYSSGETTNRYKVGKKLSENSENILLLSATPHRGKSDVFRNLMRVIDPYLFARNSDVTKENVNKVTIRNKKRACVDFDGEKLFKNRETKIEKINWEKGIDDIEKKLYKKVTEYISEYYNYAKREEDQIFILLLILYTKILSSSSNAILSSLKKRYLSLETEISQSNKIDLAVDSDLDDEVKLKLLEDKEPLLENNKFKKKEIKILKNCIDLAKKAVNNRDDAKLRRLKSILRKLKNKEGSLKLIIFTGFLKTQEYLKEKLEQIGYSASIINGYMNIDEKIEQKNEFKRESEILISTDAGGEGLNLQFANIVINYDLPWNPMKIEQRIGRVDRIGQKKDVYAINFVLSNSIEEYVREKLESKLNIIKEEFGQDKYEDVLNSLNEEYNFEDIYFYEIIKKIKNNDSDIEKKAEEIYRTAKKILEENDLLLPFVNPSRYEKVNNLKKNKYPNIIKSFVEYFLNLHDEDLNEYKNKKDVYYFTNPIENKNLKSKYSNVIFKQEKGVEDESLELFSFQHNFVKHITNNYYNNGETSSLSLYEDKFSGEQGVLFNWLLKIYNNHNYEKRFLIPIFVDSNFNYSMRISEYFKDFYNKKMEYNIKSENIYLENYFNIVHDKFKKIEEKKFYYERKNWQEKIKKEKAKKIKYYKERKKKIKQVKIDNIRKGKLEKIKRQEKEDLKDIKRREKLYPYSKCLQIIKIRFE